MMVQKSNEKRISSPFSNFFINTDYDGAVLYEYYTYMYALYKYKL